MSPSSRRWAEDTVPRAFRYSSPSPGLSEKHASKSWRDLQIQLLQKRLRQMKSNNYQSPRKKTSQKYAISPDKPHRSSKYLWKKSIRNHVTIGCIYSNFTRSQFSKYILKRTKRAKKKSIKHFIWHQFFVVSLRWDLSEKRCLFCQSLKVFKSNLYNIDNVHKTKTGLVSKTWAVCAWRDFRWNTVAILPFLETRSYFSAHFLL